MNPIKGILRFPVVSLVFTALFVALGLHAFLDMPRTEDPSITIRIGLVLAQYPGATAEQVEEQVTRPIEKHIFKFPEVRKDKTFSTSSHGLSIINVELEDSVTDADAFWAKLRHELIVVRNTEMPDGVRGPIVNSDFGDTVAMLIAVHGKRYGYRELRDHVDRIQDELRKIRDIGKMAVYGQQAEQVWVTTSLARLSQYVTDPMQAIRALQQRNVITGSGGVDAGSDYVPLRASGAFDSEQEVKDVLVTVTRGGEPVYVRDFAAVERRYLDPTFLVRHNGEPAILLSVEMQKDKNIVHLGESIAEVFRRLETILPPDLSLDLIADQPSVVKKRIGSLSREIMLAIGSVILVTIILLPVRVAVIAALAIPVTLLTTLGLMNAFGIELHQVSIAALIVVLGIVVDDAIVIADNYVELLDNGVPRSEAAWRSASDIVVPVFTATVTIICSFLPLLILPGSSGEFIEALPQTVAIALTVSFVVALMLTPILCRFFIRRGLKTAKAGDDTGKKKKHGSFLDLLQRGYGQTIVVLMRHKGLAVIIGIGAVVLGVWLMKFVPRQFFPTAERNQFVIDVWMRQGTRIEATDAAVRRIEACLAEQKDVVQYSSFIGQSAPRFYYNVNPQQPDAAYAQLVVMNRDERQTPAMVAELGTLLAGAVPEAMVVVKELQQGNIMEAPVEVRISGDSIDELKSLGDEVRAIVSAEPEALYVHRDWYNDTFMVDLNIDNELANRLGLTNASVARTLAGAFDGLPVSVFWEGDRPITIVLRLDGGERASFASVGNTYVTSPVTHASVPVRAIGSLSPGWESGRIVRRNGVRTITVRAFTKQGFYASALLGKVRPKIDAITLPVGYQIDYGGEKQNQDETFPEMLKALGISLLAIFIVLLLQFRNLSDPLVVMASISLMVPGGVVGLILTGNAFGFTAFMGFISLCGIVVRNAIILVEYIREKMAEGHPLEQAAIEAGQRRLRPIFLTSMAAAVGVTPMILSGSSLWSPLASVIAMGLIASMFFTLLVVPAIYVLIHKLRWKTAVPVAAVLLFTGSVLWTAAPAKAETVRLSLDEIVEKAIGQNAVLAIERARVRETRAREDAVKAEYLPLLSDYSVYAVLSDSNVASLPAGSLGTVPILGAFPTETIEIEKESNSTFANALTLRQPLTQLLKVGAAERIAVADRHIAEKNLCKTTADIVLLAKKLVCGRLMAEKQKDLARAGMRAADARIKESADALAAGNVLKVAVDGARIQRLQARQSLLEAEHQIGDIDGDLSDLTGMPLDTRFEPVGGLPGLPAIQSESEYIESAYCLNPELRAAREAINKADGAVDAARYDYIPDIGLFGSYIYQDGIPYVDQDIGAAGVVMEWDIFDWGKRGAVMAQRRAQHDQACRNVERLKRRIAVDVGKAYRKLTRAGETLDLARAAVAVREERLRIGGDQQRTGLITEAAYADLEVAHVQAEVDLVKARIGQYLAMAELQRTVGIAAEREFSGNP